MHVWLPLTTHAWLLHGEPHIPFMHALHVPVWAGHLERSLRISQHGERYVALSNHCSWRDTQNSALGHKGIALQGIGGAHYILDSAVVVDW